MAISTEKKIKQLEDELLSLKATYSIYGGNMKLYTSYSDVYDLGSQVVILRLKFTPDFAPSGTIIIGSIHYVNSTGEGDSYNLSNYAYSEIQDGSGSVVIRMPVVGGTAQISLVSTSPGTFTRIQ